MDLTSSKKLGFRAIIGLEHRTIPPIRSNKPPIVPPPFKNLTLYRIRAGWLSPSDLTEDAQRIAEALDARRFVACSAGQPQSVGWVSPLLPRGLNDPSLGLIETVAGQWLLCLMTEQRLLPASVVRRRTEELMREAEQATGRKPGKRQRQQIKEQAQMELLPRAFTRQIPIDLWIDPGRGLLAIDTTSLSRAEAVVTELVRSLDGLVIEPIQTQESPSTVMAAWLTDGEPGSGFFLERECELKADDDMRSSVRYARHALDTEEVRGQIVQHLQQGKRPIRLALTWSARVSFTLTDTMQLRKLDFLDTVFEDQEALGSKDALASFHSEVAIRTGELGRLIPVLIEALGGEADASLAA